MILERNWSLSRFWLKAEGQFKSLEALADAKRALKNSTGGMNVWSENLNAAKFLVFVHIKKVGK